MNTMTKRLVALISLAICAFTFGISAYAETPTSNNNGIRHAVCTELSDAAEIYYANYSYEELANKSSSELLATLRGLMISTHSYKSSYSDCRDLASKTDSTGSDGKISLIYTSVSVTRADFGGSEGTWNREHIWAKSLGGFDNAGAGADLHHIRPSDASINSARGNKKFGNVTSGTEAKGSALVGGMSGGTYNGSYFEPLDNAKGDIARICLYVYARYGGEISKCNSITNVFESADVLLEWCALDPVDEWEMERNNTVEKIQGNRNVFIDYPEYAWLIFGEEMPKEMSTPSGNAKDSGTPPIDESGCTHEFDAWDIVDSEQKMRICRLCGEVETAPLEQGDCLHNFDEWDDMGDGQKMRICSICGELEFAPSDDLSTVSPLDSVSVVSVIIYAAIGVAATVGISIAVCVIIRKKKR